jgi:hypothetical protein
MAASGWFFRSDHPEVNPDQRVGPIRPVVPMQSTQQLSRLKLFVRGIVRKSDDIGVVCATKSIRFTAPLVSRRLIFVPPKNPATDETDGSRFYFLTKARAVKPPLNSRDRFSVARRARGRGLPAPTATGRRRRRTGCRGRAVESGRPARAMRYRAAMDLPLHRDDLAPRSRQRSKRGRWSGAWSISAARELVPRRPCWARFISGVGVHASFRGANHSLEMTNP